MRTETAKTIRLADYTPPAYLVESVELSFKLHESATIVSSRIRFYRNPAASDGGDLELDGVGLKLKHAAIDGHTLNPGAIVITDKNLTVPVTELPNGAFEWTCEVEINPAANTALEGLYRSKGMFCTQCEAEGFRKITYYPDRPDVLAEFTVNIEGDAPVLLSNGNLIEQRDGSAKWHDPHPKPSYLFALVAGDLVSYDDTFTTKSGRHVDLRIFVRDGDQTRCAYAMDALKRSMKWDEEVYGLEYDLDLFMIVAVDDFNMGAMENKGLNIFNSKYVLASPETATDTDYELIEGIIAHEYFHNWTGNRITCRDWFQLSLKEGLTVYRDQCFSADMRSEAVQRIKDVQALRSRQFREDSGPLAHPVQPDSYIEINNFYTSTIYEKGAEVIRMLAILVGPDGYSKALNLYFERHDGQACTIQDWISVFEDATGHNLTNFKRWYTQAGTPIVKVKTSYSDNNYTIKLSQKTKPTPGQKTKEPLTIPIAYGFIGADGQQIGDNGVLEFTQKEETFTFELPEEPVPSLFRQFSAPIILDAALTRDQQIHLLAHDSDAFNRWEAGRALALATLIKIVLQDQSPDASHLNALKTAALDDSADPAFRALLLNIPSEDEIATTLQSKGTTPDPDKIYTARRNFAHAIATHFGQSLTTLYDDMATPGPYTPDAKNAGRRALRSAVLGLMTAIDDTASMAQAQYDNADNMTEKLSALRNLVTADKAEAALDAFHAQWHDNPNVLDKWFAIQVAAAAPEKAVEITKALSQHPDFEWKTPNRFRALFGGLVQNTSGFHRKDGSGYAIFTDWLLKLDALNPQTAARMCAAFETWTRYDKTRKAAMKAQLDRIAATKTLSKDSREMVERILKA